MLPLSVVVVVRNEARNIAACLQPWREAGCELLVADNGSTDGTPELAAAAGARVLHLAWKGYGATKNEANALAANDWILSLDADEVADAELVQAIVNLPPEAWAPGHAWRLRRRLVYLGRVLRFGAAAAEFRIRMFRRSEGQWNTAAVHEDVSFQTPVKLQTLPGCLLHYSVQDEAQHRERLRHYATLFAEQGRKVPAWKPLLSPLFGFLKNYVFRLGFLDGYAGFRYARNEMGYTALKYRLSRERQRKA